MQGTFPRSHQLPDKTPHAEKPAIGYLTKFGVLRPGLPKEPFSVLSDEARHVFDIPDDK